VKYFVKRLGFGKTKRKCSKFGPQEAPQNSVIFITSNIGTICRKRAGHRKYSYR